MKVYQLIVWLSMCPHNGEIEFSDETMVVLDNVGVPVLLVDNQGVSGQAVDRRTPYSMRDDGSER